MLLPVYGEAAFDSWMWSKGLKDKPASTIYVRPLLFSIGFFFAYQVGDKLWWSVLFVMGTAFLAWFPLLINLILKKHLTYVNSTDWWDKLMGKIPGLFRVWVFIWLYITALCVYYYDELYYNI